MVLYMKFVEFLVVSYNPSMIRILVIPLSSIVHSVYRIQPYQIRYCWIYLFKLLQQNQIHQEHQEQEYTRKVIR